MKLKKISVVILFLLIAAQLNAQTFNEWFRQKKTQKKYLVQQIAALKIYLKYLKQGYRIVDKGLNLVGDIKDGNFHSHKTYFESLRDVNSVVANSGNISSLIFYEEMVIKHASKMRSEFIGNPFLTAEEIDYIQLVCENLMRLSRENTASAENLLTSQKLEMKDDERIARLRVLCLEAKDRFSFAREFYNGNHLMIMQRDKETGDIEKQKQLERL